MFVRLLALVKTSLGKSVAEALGRSMLRIQLGRDLGMMQRYWAIVKKYIRGHAGRIVQSLNKKGG